jgi:hypothetical protein
MAELNETLVQRIEAINKKKASWDTQKALLTKQKGELTEKIKAQGFDASKLPEEIEKLTKNKQLFEEKAGPILDRIEKAAQGVENEQHVTDEFAGFEQGQS